MVETGGLDASLCPHSSRPCCPLTSSPLTDPKLQHAVLVSSGLPSLRPPVHFTESNDTHGVWGKGGIDSWDSEGPFLNFPVQC